MLNRLHLHLPSYYKAIKTANLNFVETHVSDNSSCRPGFTPVNQLLKLTSASGSNYVNITAPQVSNFTRKPKLVCFFKRTLSVINTLYFSFYSYLEGL